MARQTAAVGSFWESGVATTGYAPLAGDLEVDVAVVGGGIAGLSTAWQLAEAGRRVAVVEALRIGRQVTGHSTAKVTAQHSLIYTDLERRFDEQAARTYGEANRWGLDEVARRVAALRIDCAFERRDAFFTTADPGKRPALEAEAAAAGRCGLATTVVAAAPSPVRHALALCCADQAQFNPVAYCAGLAEAIAGKGGRIFEQTRVVGVEDGAPCKVQTGQGTITARAVVVATNIPVVPEGEFYQKTRPRSHIGLAAPFAGAPPLAGMILSLDPPTHSLRVAPGPAGPVLVAIGEGFRTGGADTARKLAELKAFVDGAVELGPVSHVWWNEDYDSIDRLPFIGLASPQSQHLLVSTGFSSWGFTNGTAAGRILADLVEGRDNPWAGLFDARRQPEGDAGEPAEPQPEAGRTAESLKPGEAGVFDAGGQPLAGYRDAEGRLFVRSAKCTHLGCTLAWNAVEKGWYCACHGSSFDHQGHVLHGPAFEDLPSFGG